LQESTNHTGKNLKFNEAGEKQNSRTVSTTSQSRRPKKTRKKVEGENNGIRSIKNEVRRGKEKDDLLLDFEPDVIKKTKMEGKDFYSINFN